MSVPPPRDARPATTADSSGRSVRAVPACSAGCRIDRTTTAGSSSDDPPDSSAHRHPTSKTHRCRRWVRRRPSPRRRSARRASFVVRGRHVEPRAFPVGRTAATLARRTRPACRMPLDVSRPAIRARRDTPRVRRLARRRRTGTAVSGGGIEDVGVMKNAIDRLSGDQNGRRAPSVPGKARLFAEVQIPYP